MSIDILTSHIQMREAMSKSSIFRIKISELIAEKKIKALNSVTVYNQPHLNMMTLKHVEDVFDEYEKKMSFDTYITTQKYIQLIRENQLDNWEKEKKIKLLKHLNELFEIAIRR